MASCGTFQKLRPLSLLAHLSSCYDSAHLKVNSGSIFWSIYLEQGKITYASHSIAPFDRLDCHLHRLSYKIPSLSSEIRAQLRLLFETDPESQSMPNSDYQAIRWLVDRQYLNATQAAELIAGLVKEVIESFLLVKQGTYELNAKLGGATDFCRLDFQPIVEDCQKRLQAWKSLGPEIWSPYQRPYFSNHKLTEQQILPEINKKLSAILKGFSFRHLAILLNQDELQLAQSLHQYVINGTILLQAPYPPFDQLPKIGEPSLVTQVPALEAVYKPPAPISPITINNSVTSSDKIFPIAQSSKNSPPENITLNLKNNQPGEVKGNLKTPPEKIILNPPNTQPAELKKDPVNIPVTINNTVDKTASPSNKIPTESVSKSTYKIVCVDDSPTMLKELNYFLDDESFSVFTIGDSVKALMQIVRVKPDLILLDVNMAGIDGYELCKLLRNHSLFKNTPVIMVTGNTGIIDRVKARLVGASGYLTKPFTQSDLLKLVFRHLS